jgi:hypothetical protein
MTFKNKEDEPFILAIQALVAQLQITYFTKHEVFELMGKMKVEKMSNLLLDVPFSHKYFGILDVKSPSFNILNMLKDHDIVDEVKQISDNYKINLELVGLIPN